MGKSLKLGRHSHSKEAGKYKQNRKIQFNAKMGEFKEVQVIVNQVAIQATTAAVMAIRQVDAGLRSGTSAASIM